MRMQLERITMPEYSDFLLWDARIFLRVTDNEEDTLIARLINAAAISRMDYTGRELLTAEFKLHLSGTNEEVYVPRPPLKSVESIKYFDKDNVEQTLDTSDYEVIISEHQGRIKFISHPATLHTQRTYPVVVNFTAGYSDDIDKVPEDLVQDILVMVGTMYKQRETLGNTGQMDLVRMFNRMIASRKVRRFA